MKETTITITKDDVKDLLYVDMHKKIRKKGNNIIITIPESQYNIAYLFVLLNRIHEQCKDKNIIIYEDHRILPTSIVNDIIEILMIDRKPVQHMISLVKFIKKINIEAEKNIDNDNDLI